MKKQLVIIGIFTIFILAGILSGCDEQKAIEPKTEEEKFVGTWKDPSTYTTMDLLSDGTCKVWSYPGTWDLKDGKLVIAVTSIGIPSTYTYIYIFFDNYKTLKLIPTINTTGIGYVLNRQ